MSEELLMHMAETACVRAWEDEGWGPLHRRLLTMVTKIEHPGYKRNTMTNYDVITKHLNTTGSISVREAMDDYQISGGTLTKVISDLRRRGMAIEKKMQRHPVLARRYARYYLLTKRKVA